MQFQLYPANLTPAATWTILAWPGTGTLQQPTFTAVFDALGVFTCAAPLTTGLQTVNVGGVASALQLSETLVAATGLLEAGSLSIAAAACTVDDSGNLTAASVDAGGELQLDAGGIIRVGTGATFDLDHDGNLLIQQITLLGTLFGGTEVGLTPAAPGVWQLTAGASGSGTLCSPMLSPAVLGVDQNDYNPGPCRYLLVTTDPEMGDNLNFTGLLAGVDGQELVIINQTGSTLTLVHQSSSSTAANRFLCSTGSSMVLSLNARSSLVYDATAQRWRAF